MNNNFPDKIIDIHTHVFSDKVVKKSIEFLIDHYKYPVRRSGTAKDLKSEMTKYGVDYACVLVSATVPSQVNVANDFSKSLKDDSFINFGTLHPNYKDSKAEYKRIKELGLRGLKFHNDFQKINIDSQVMFDLIEIIDDDMPVIFHLGDSNLDYAHPRRMAKLISKFSNKTIIGAHMGGHNRWEEVKEHLLGKQIYFDTSSTLFKVEENYIVDMMRKHGIEKILFGTDYPMFSYGDEFERIKKLPLTKSELEMIMYKNAARILKI